MQWIVLWYGWISQHHRLNLHNQCSKIYLYDLIRMHMRLWRFAESRWANFIGISDIIWHQCYDILCLLMVRLQAWAVPKIFSKLRVSSDVAGFWAFRLGVSGGIPTFHWTKHNNVEAKHSIFNSFQEALNKAPQMNQHFNQSLQAHAASAVPEIHRYSVLLDGLCGWVISVVI